MQTWHVCTANCRRTLSCTSPAATPRRLSRAYGWEGAPAQARLAGRCAGLGWTCPSSSAHAPQQIGARASEGVLVLQRRHGRNGCERCSPLQVRAQTLPTMCSRAASSWLYAGSSGSTGAHRPCAAPTRYKPLAFGRGDLNGKRSECCVCMLSAAGAHRRILREERLRVPAWQQPPHFVQKHGCVHLQQAWLRFHKRVHASHLRQLLPACHVATCSTCRVRPCWRSGRRGGAL